MNKSHTKIQSNKTFGGKWLHSEDQTLIRLVEAHGENWVLISARMGSQRTPLMCENRWKHSVQLGNEKGPWSEEEDAIIKKAVDQGIKKWSDVAKLVRNRNGKQCRERWNNHLNPTLKRERWTDEEDRILVESQYLYGNTWKRIAIEIKGRSENEIKNRWNSMALKRKLKLMTPAGTHKQEDNTDGSLGKRKDFDPSDNALDKEWVPDTFNTIGITAGDVIYIQQAVQQIKSLRLSKLPIAQIEDASPIAEHTRTSAECTKSRSDSSSFDLPLFQSMDSWSLSFLQKELWQGNDSRAETESNLNIIGEDLRTYSHTTMSSEEKTITSLMKTISWDKSNV